jgi:predicted dehydrogenase
VAPCLAALAAGYDVLLEKPIAPTEAECRTVLAAAEATDRIVAVCHVLRYAPYFVRMRALIRSGAIGRLVSIQHMEPIGHVHMAHSYVRGNWRRSDQTSPIILAKSSHDLDILRWLTDRPTRAVQAFGARSWFTAANAPEGSTERCTGGCTVEASCPYSARRIYYEQRQRLYVFNLAADEPARSADILRALDTTNYGRCVYRMDNDQCDHYTVNLRYEDDITATFTMDAFTPMSGRRTRVMGSHGYLDGDMQHLEAHDFRTGAISTWVSDVVEPSDDAQSGHGGGDWRMVADFVQAVAHRDPGRLTSTLAQSIESHLVAFACERSRARGRWSRFGAACERAVMMAHGPVGATACGDLEDAGGTPATHEGIARASAAFVATIPRLLTPCVPPRRSHAAQRLHCSLPPSPWPAAPSRSTNPIFRVPHARRWCRSAGS